MLSIPIVIPRFLTFSLSLSLFVSFVFPAAPHAFTNKIELIVEMKTKTTKNRNEETKRKKRNPLQAAWHGTPRRSGGSTTEFLLLV